MPVQECTLCYNRTKSGKIVDKTFMSGQIFVGDIKNMQGLALSCIGVRIPIFNIGTKSYSLHWNRPVIPIVYTEANKYM